MPFLIGSIIVLNAIWIFMPKRLTKSEMYVNALFVAVLELTVDIILDLEYDLYGYFAKGVDLRTFLAVFGVYPALANIYTNYYPLRWSKRVPYIIGWTAFALVYEWLAVQSGYFYHNNWNFWYSALWYPPLFLMLNGNLYLFRRLAQSDRSHNGLHK